MILPSITPKQKQILILLYRYRCLNRFHIQTFLHHKDPRRIKTWLKDLTDKQLIHRIYHHTLGDNIKPAIYYLATKSIPVLKQEATINSELLNRFYRESDRSERFRHHWLTIADIQHTFETTTQSPLTILTSSDLSKYDYIIKPIPDLYIVKEISPTDKRRYFLDLCNPDTPRFALRKRINQYIEYFQSNAWQENTQHSFPTILLVCHTDSIKTYLHSYIPKSCNDHECNSINWFVSSGLSLQWEKVSD